VDDSGRHPPAALGPAAAVGRRARRSGQPAAAGGTVACRGGTVVRAAFGRARSRARDRERAGRRASGQTHGRGWCWACCWAAARAAAGPAARPVRPAAAGWDRPAGRVREPAGTGWPGLAERRDAPGHRGAAVGPGTAAAWRVTVAGQSRPAAPCARIIRAVSSGACWLVSSHRPVPASSLSSSGPRWRKNPRTGTRPGRCPPAQRYASHTLSR
jgi:hypothetical protein